MDIAIDRVELGELHQQPDHFSDICILSHQKPPRSSDSTNQYFKIATAQSVAHDSIMSTNEEPKTLLLDLGPIEACEAIHCLRAGRGEFDRRWFSMRTPSSERVGGLCLKRLVPFNRRTGIEQHALAPQSLVQAGVSHDFQRARVQAH